MEQGVEERQTVGVRTQNLRDFTVQIRRADNDAIVGTGIAVSTDGKIVTCAHVVRAAGVEPRNADGQEIGVYFPQALGGEKKDHQAKVVAFFPDHDDDVVLLQLADGAVPLGPERMPTLGTAKKSQDNPFRSYGYRRLEKYIAGWAHGKIHGHVEPPDGQNLQEEPVQLESNQINQGMSGAPVLDIERNLVVGIVSETWFPYSDGKDSDTAWAVDTRVLSLEPLGLTIQDASLSLKPAPQPKFDPAQAQAAVFLKEKYALHNAPAVLPEWTGRDHLLAQITADWNDPHKHVTGLIGFGGEGKSSLARKWVENVIARRRTEGSTTKQSPSSRGEIASGQNPPLAMTEPDGIFWWGFYENRSVDEFLEAALNYLSGGRIDPRQVPSSSLRAQIIGAMLGSGRYLFVLDGLEVMQHEEGDRYGLFTSNDLRDLLTYFARPDHESFCLVTSRAPLLDLMDYTTYTHRDVDRLSPDDGRALLKRLGVKGDDTALDKIVTDWDGHALTLSLLGSYLSEHFGGDIAHLDDIPAPTAIEERYERVHRVLRRYDEHLTDEERQFLKLFSAFRTPVHESAFEKVFVPLLEKFTAKDTKAAKEETKPDQPITSNQSPFTHLQSLISNLLTYRLLRHDTPTQTYTAHPLVRNHYLAHLTHETGAPDTHIKIKDYYLSLAGDTPRYPTLDDLKPLIEVVHHACQAGAYIEAHQIRRERIDQVNRFVMLHQLGAFETYLNLVIEFFPNRDLSKNPEGKIDEQRWTLNTVGACLMSLGRLREAVPFYERKNELYEKTSTGYKNLASLHAHLGALDESARAAGQALDLARRAENKQDEMTSLSWQGTVFHLLGKIEEAQNAFLNSEQVEREVESDKKYLYSYAGIQHADHLRRMGDPAYARRVTEVNLQICEQAHWPDDTSKSHRVLGDLDAASGDHASAGSHYEAALKIARGISKRDVLIEALLARGRWAAKYYKEIGDLGSLDQVFNDLNEVLGYCVESGYRIYEADVRVALAWAWLADGGLGAGDRAKAEAERALQMSVEMGYHWGQADAREVLEEVGNQ